MTVETEPLPEGAITLTQTVLGLADFPSGFNEREFLEQGPNLLSRRAEESGMYLHGQAVKLSDELGYLEPADDPNGTFTPLLTGGTIRRLVWTSVAAPQTRAVAGTRHEATTQDDGAAVLTLDVIPQAPAILSVHHQLATEGVAVEAFRADGTAMGYMESVPISLVEIEVVVMPGTGRLRLSVPPETDDDDASSPPDA